MRKRILYNIRIYFIISINYVKSQMQFRADFIIGLIGTALQLGLGLVALWILFKSIANISGWNFKELLFIYSFTLLVMIPQGLLFQHMWSLSWHIRSGSFIKYYFRPINMLLYYISDMVTISSLGHIIVAITSFVYASAALKIKWTLGGVCFLITSWAGSSLIYISIIMLASSVAFYANSNYALILFFCRFNEFAKYPVTIFKGFLKIILTYIIPVAFMGYYPALHFLRPQEENVLVYLSPFIGVFLFIIAYRVWCAGINRYSGTGT